MPTSGPNVGDRLGRYELIRSLGRGGAGAVWEAVLHGPEGFRKPVAIKMLLPSTLGPRARSQLAKEARLGAMLQHPNVVATLDLGAFDGRPYIAMELVRGPTCARVLRDGPLTGRALWDVARQACAGLQHIHALRLPGAEAGLVHADLKPSNLLLDPSGLLKIADLGVARLSGRDGEVVGTPGYLAPEQLDGHTDQSSDLFQLGACLVTLATGRPPFGRGNRALAGVMRVETRLADPTFLEPVDEALAGLADIVFRCLRADPRQRWSDAEALGVALSGLSATGAGLSERIAPAPSVPGTPGDATVVVSRRGNVRLPADEFVGRTAELADVERQLRAGRLVTLLGLGGMGKTRLSLHAASRFADLPGGGWFVDLSEATTLPALLGTVARVLEVRVGGGDVTEQIGAALAERGPTLVVLDNLEQVVEAAATALQRWLELAPRVRWLCTSRIALQLRTEQRVPLGPLAEEAAETLFRERAPRPVTPDEEDALRALVVDLEGMPLAIELAAARLRVLTVGEVRRRMVDRLRLLAGGERDRPERHRSVRASLDGTWELLPQWARLALAQLTAFEGGFTLEAAEAVIDAGDDAPWAIDLLDHLVASSVVRLVPASGRFRIPVLVHEYASEHLDAASRLAAEARHGRAMAATLSKLVVDAAMTGGGADRVRRLLAEGDNVLAACRRAVDRGDAEVAARCFYPAVTIFQLRGPYQGGIDLGTAILAMVDLGDYDRMDIEHAVGHALGRLKDPAAIEMLGQALARAEALGLRGNASLVETNLAMILADLDRTDEALERLASARANAETVGNRRLVAIASDQRGLVFRMAGRPEESTAAHRAAVDEFRAIGNRRSLGVSLGNLGAQLVRNGQLDEAHPVLVEAVELHREIGNRMSEAITTARLAEILERSGEASDAIAHYQAAVAISREVGNQSLLTHCEQRVAELEKR